MTTKKPAAAPTGGARFSMSFPSSLIEEPLMHKLSTDLKVMPNILRGRITAKSAKLEIELTGKPADIEKAVKYLESKGVTLKKTV
jgi:ABC-type methionine transport system ATPase subunit